MGPRNLELNICVAWCFPFEKWVFPPERMVVHTKSVVLWGVVQVTSAVGRVVHPLLIRGYVQKVHCRGCSFFDSSHML